MGHYNVQRRGLVESEAWECVLHHVSSMVAKYDATSRAIEDHFAEFRVVDFDQACTCKACCNLRNSMRPPEYMLESPACGYAGPEPSAPG